jgi:mRNA interferase MazF
MTDKSKVRRGDVVTIALQGSYGKPRPALVIQSDLFDEHPSVTVLPITSELRATPLFRIQIEPDEQNGLQKPSQVMLDKAQTIPRDKIGDIIGQLNSENLLAINRGLAVFLGFA